MADRRFIRALLAVAGAFPVLLGVLGALLESGPVFLAALVLAVLYVPAAVVL